VAESGANIVPCRTGKDLAHALFTASLLVIHPQPNPQWNQMALGSWAGGWSADVATSTGAPAAGAPLPRAPAPAPGYWQPQADVVFMTGAPAASLTATELTLTGVPDTMQFITPGMGTGNVRTGAPSVKKSCPHKGVSCMRGPGLCSC